MKSDRSVHLMTRGRIPPSDRALAGLVKHRSLAKRIVADLQQALALEKWEISGCQVLASMVYEDEWAVVVQEAAAEEDIWLLTVILEEALGAGTIHLILGTF
ncbi:hypothetical protein NDU88_000274 [Pleurodeles waltl]|uniref:DUF4279 domain-containing protein n=1 Tax=Pleurodeles waltl TaxID=8319 RepID=A0AAV7S854_PLEWA|nr:hypothetical protein NDU88_000274 [Pleurodeles waltl]